MWGKVCAALGVRSAKSRRLYWLPWLRNQVQKLWPEATGICSQSGDQKFGLGSGGEGGGLFPRLRGRACPSHSRPSSASDPGCSLPGSITPVRLSPHGGLPWVSVLCPNDLLKNHQSLDWALLIQPVLILICLHLPRPQVHTRSGTGTSPQDLSTVGGGHCTHCRGHHQPHPSRATPGQLWWLPHASNNFRFSAGKGDPP